MPPKSVGYSGTPLAKKLGIKAGTMVWVIGAPTPYEDFFDDIPENVEIDDSSPDIPSAQGCGHFIHIFASNMQDLKSRLQLAKPAMKLNGILWVSWPKKTSSIPSEIGKFDVMKAGKEIGLVDVKVAAINDDWSGHKFVYRVKDRKTKSKK